MRDVDLMYNSIEKNIEELTELCVEYNITNAYDLMDVVSNFSTLCRYLKTQNESPNLRGLNNNILNQLEKVFSKEVLYDGNIK